MTSPSSPSFPVANASTLIPYIQGLAGPGGRKDGQRNIAYRACYEIAVANQVVENRDTEISLICPWHGPFQASWRDLCHRGAGSRATCIECDLEHGALKRSHSGTLGSKLADRYLHAPFPKRIVREADGTEFNPSKRYMTKDTLIVECLRKPDGKRICGHQQPHRISNLDRDIKQPGQLGCRGECARVGLLEAHEKRAEELQQELSVLALGWTLEPASYQSQCLPATYRHDCGYLRRSCHTKFMPILSNLPKGKTGCPACDKAVPEKSEWDDLQALTTWVGAVDANYAFLRRIPAEGPLMIEVQCRRHQCDVAVSAKGFRQRPSRGCRMCETELRRRPKNRWRETAIAVTRNRSLILSGEFPTSPREKVQWHHAPSGRCGTNTILELCSLFQPKVSREVDIPDELFRYAVLGLAASDGWLTTSPIIRICLLAEDEDVLITAARGLGLKKTKLKYTATSEDRSPGLYATLDIGDPSFVADAMDVCSFTRNKSLTLQMPLFGAPEKTWAYIAGFFSGDGSTSISTRDRSMRIEWVSGSKAIAHWLASEIPCFISPETGGYPAIIPIDSAPTLDNETAAKLYLSHPNGRPFFTLVVASKDAKREIAAQLLRYGALLPRRKRDALAVLANQGDVAEYVRRVGSRRVISKKIAAVA